MAFTQANLSLIGVGNKMKLWMYQSTDSTSTIWTTGYFRDADGNAPTGFAAADVILFVNTTTGNYAIAPTCVSAVASTYVTLARKTGYAQIVGYE